MSTKGNQIVGWLVQLVVALRPRTYNLITRSLVFSGLILVLESQVKLFHALIIALVETYIGESELLRLVLTSKSDTFIGMTLIVVGLLYHLIAEYLHSRRSPLTPVPSLTCYLLNGDKEPLDTEFTIRGKRALLPPKNEIPDQDDGVPSDYNSVTDQVARAARLYSGQQINTELYRERADVLNEWAGAELIYVVIKNDGSVLANDVSVQLTIPRSASISVKVDGQIVPPVPQKTFNQYENLMSSTLQNLNRTAMNELTLTVEGNRHVILWQAHKLQARTATTSEEAILIKTMEPIDLECTIFCDELPEPIVKTFHVKHASESTKIYPSQLKNEDRYDALCDELIMNGYIGRMHDNIANLHEEDLS